LYYNEVLVHARIVRFIMFEIESLGIILPLGSLYDYIKKSMGVMLWTDRYQMITTSDRLSIARFRVLGSLVKLLNWGVPEGLELRKKKDIR
jgi:hypothetical protein